MWTSSLIPILVSLGRELSDCLAGEEADKPYESTVMRGGDSVDGGRPLSDRCFCLSSMLAHDLARAHAVPRRQVTDQIGAQDGVYNVQISVGFYVLYLGQPPPTRTQRCDRR